MATISRMSIACVSGFSEVMKCPLRRGTVRRKTLRIHGSSAERKCFHVGGRVRFGGSWVESLQSP